MLDAARLAQKFSMMLSCSLVFASQEVS